MLSRQNNRSHLSIRLLQIVVIVVGLLILGRLFQLQILQYDLYNPQSKSNAIRKSMVEPARGLIYGREGRLIVDNIPTYTITITPAKYDTTQTSLLASLLNVPILELKKRVEEARSYSWYRASQLYTDLSFDTFTAIAENIWRLPGISHKVDSKRHYPIDSLSASHLLGYLGEIAKEKILTSNRFIPGDRIGQTGLEKSYNKKLNGLKGTEFILVNALGRTLGPYRDGARYEAPVEGFSLYTTIGVELQILAEELMKGKTGALVALNPENGAVLAMVSSPQFNLRKLSGEINAAYWDSLTSNPDNPLFNRAISSQQPPGSTVKPMMALIGLELNLITPETVIYNPGYFYLGRRYNDHADPGKYDLVKAIAQSSNTYFFKVMYDIITKYSIDRWHEMAADFGLGSKTGIDLPSEVSGILPDSSYFNKAFGKGQWGIGDMINLGIGQGRFSASPLQMAVMAAIMANGGYRIQPHLVQAIKKPDGTVHVNNTKKNKIDWIDPADMKVVRWGMRKVVTDGSSGIFTDLENIKVAGKTGTAQNPHGRDHGWFIAFAPYKNPEIAIAVLIENAGFGSITAAPIASLIIEKYLTGKNDRPYVMKYVKEEIYLNRYQ